MKISWLRCYFIAIMIAFISWLGYSGDNSYNREFHIYLNKVAWAVLVYGFLIHGSDKKANCCSNPVVFDKNI